MERELMHDPVFLALPSEDAVPADLQTGVDLQDTLRAHLSGCVGMAANMIGQRKRVICFADGKELRTMYNPRLLEGKDEYMAEEGCLSLSGTRKVKRYRTIRVRYMDERFRSHIQTLRGFTAQIVQHELDHCDGILV